MQTLQRPPHPVPEADVEALIEEARRRHRQRRRRALLSVVALAIAAAAGGYVLAGGGPGRHSSGSRPSSLPAVLTAGVLSGTPIQTASGLGSVWVLTCERPCPNPPSISSGTLLRVNSRTGQIVQRINVTDPQAFAIGDGSLWLAHFYRGQVTRIDPRTGRTAQNISLPPLNRLAQDGRRFLPESITAEPGAVWVASARGRLAEIDPSSGQIVSMLHAPFDATGQIVGSHETWVAESSLGVGIVRPGASRLKLLPIQAGSGQLAIDQLALGGGLVWAYGEIATGASNNGSGTLTNTARLVTLDRRTGRIVHQLSLPAGPYAIAYGDGALFMADDRNGQLLRIDPAYRIHPLRRVRGLGRTLITVTPDAIWATSSSGVLRRIAIPAR